jgi:alpha-mannosidase
MICHPHFIPIERLRLNSPAKIGRAGALFALLMAGSLYAAPFTPLVPLPPPKIRASSGAFSEPQYQVANLFDGKANTEYASREAGTNTSVEFDFGAPTKIAAFHHLERNDPATIEASELDFFSPTGTLLATLAVRHANKPAGETFFILPEPLLAQRVKWRVTKVGNGTYHSVGGAEIAFLKALQPEALPTRDRIHAELLPILETNGQHETQPAMIVVEHPYLEAADAKLRVNQGEARAVRLQPGKNSFTFDFPGITRQEEDDLTLEMEGQRVATAHFTREPVRPLTIYVLPHSHTDIGYTEIQTAVAKKQVDNLLQGISDARRTADYPAGARFVWNVEVAWAADLYLHRLSETQRQEFFDAVKNGWVSLNGMYLNELTGLCRPEELLRLFRFGTTLGARCGVTVDAAMISDVPGYTWGTVEAMAQAGIKYFSTAPNNFDRIGDILVQNQDKPFYWVSPSGAEQVLVWIPFRGYSLSHSIGELSQQFILNYEAELDAEKYPYDISYIRWSGHGDNATPDPAICEFVRDWNAKHRWPKFVISSTHEAFSEFEKQYGPKLPRRRGDWTPYWEDGAGSSALETAMNRANADRLTQAETVWAMFNPGKYPAERFDEAWREVLLYSEHTWGADCSVTAPESKKTREQWAIKASYVTNADSQSRALLAEALRLPADKSTAAPAEEIAVINTSSWNRTDLATLTPEQSVGVTGLSDEAGKVMPAQRLKSGEFVFLARDIPGFTSRRFKLSKDNSSQSPSGLVHDNVLENEFLHVEINPRTGGIMRLEAKGIQGNLVDQTSGHEINDFLFLPGDKLADLQSNGPVKISIGENGPLVASLVIESEAPGCRKLTRELRLRAGADYLELIDDIDKLAQREGKESVNFAFPFNVPDGVLKLDVPFGEMRPDTDQIPGSCKNWFTVNRWADVANQDYGVTWVTLDAPLIEVGGLTARLLNSQTDPGVWRKKVEQTQKFYSWVMNNHWGTNYRRYQEGHARFRYFLRPHRAANSADISRFALGFSQPLLIKPATDAAPTEPLLQVGSGTVLVPLLKPSDDGQAWIVRLFEATGETQKVKLDWGNRQPRAVFVSDTSERAGEKITGPISLRGFGLMTIRVEF